MSEAKPGIGGDPQAAKDEAQAAPGRPGAKPDFAGDEKPKPVDTAPPEKSEETGSAPAAGVEREDAQADDSTAAQLARQEGPQVITTRRGMWSDGSPDTSGYGEIVRTVEFPVGEPLPSGSWQEAVRDRLEKLVPNPFDRVVLDRGELTFFVPREKLLEAMQALRDDAHLRFELCASVSGVHYPHEAGSELHVVYHLQSMTHNRRLRVETSAPDGDAHVPSVVGVYPAADWHERETWDMFGVIFDGHPNLTRILMPDDWYGHPQRKDYPLGGIPVEYKGAVVPPPDQRRNYR
ncbi:NADH-quinone oxidoreductase subunit C [Nigerium sp.]|uniref:NADH-quinone oxidoreductase subunit C n=1 Tax=Nigerium sp. TaxID=2042655 RepID=UPI003221573B